jgi:hypothetical protein
MHHLTEPYSPASAYFLPIRPKYSSQQRALKFLPTVFSPLEENEIHMCDTDYTALSVSTFAAHELRKM